MPWILDLIVIAIIALFTFLSIKRGFVRTIIEISGFICVILFVNRICPVLAGITYDKLLEPSILKSVEGLPIENVSFSAIENAIPKYVLNFLGDGFNLQNFQNIINDNINNGVDTAMLSASQTVIKPIISQVLTLVYSILITIILLFVVSIVANLVNKLFSFSFVGKLNKILGAVLGMIKGVVISIIICTLISLIVSVTQTGFLIFTPINISNSYLFKLLSLNFIF